VYSGLRLSKGPHAWVVAFGMVGVSAPAAHDRKATVNKFWLCLGAEAAFVLVFPLPLPACSVVAGKGRP
jgi:hypothetical protein